MRPAGFALTLGIAALLGAQQIPTIRVPVRLVSVPTLVFSGESRLVPGLQASDFRVLDDGRRQTLSLDESATPVSVVLAIQVNRDVREYVPFIAKTGSTVEALLVGETGESAVVTYGSDVTLVKAFGPRDVQSSLRTISPSGKPARAIDAGIRAVSLLVSRPKSRARILLFIGQPVDSGSESKLADLREAAERENVTVYSLTLPVAGKEFVSDTFSLQGVSFAEKGGYRAGIDLATLVSVLNRSARVETATDPFSILTTATGGTQIRFRKQREFEDAIAAIGVELRSLYRLSYYPTSSEPGYHTVKVEVNIPGAKIYARPGYWRGAN